MACTIVHFLPVFKCSVSCGTGYQIRKIDCVVPSTLGNGSHTDYLHTHNGNKNNRKNDHPELLSDAPSNGLIDESMQILSNEQTSMDCDPKLKPIATQSCTTGIECTTIINDNIDNSSHEETDRISSENENEHENGNEDENENENGNENENENENENDNVQIDNDNGNGNGNGENDNTNSATDNAEGVDDVNIDQNTYETSVEVANEDDEGGSDGNVENASIEGNTGGGDSEETEDTEVFRYIQ